MKRANPWANNPVLAARWDASIKQLGNKWLLHPQYATQPEDVRRRQSFNEQMWYPARVLAATQLRAMTEGRV